MLQVGWGVDAAALPLIEEEAVYHGDYCLRGHVTN